MGKIIDFFGAVPVPIQPFPNNQVQQQVTPQPVEQPRPGIVGNMVLVNRNEDAYHIVRRVQQNHFGRKIT